MNSPADTFASYADLKLSLYSNLALAHLQTKPVPAAAARKAIDAASSALAIDLDADATPSEKQAALDEGKIRRSLTAQEKAKALYRRAQAYNAVKEGLAALADLTAAKGLLPGDTAIEREYATTKAAIDAERKKRQAAYGKMFK
jgi:peptidyl-prolyl isomerase D